MTPPFFTAVFARLPLAAATLSALAALSGLSGCANPAIRAADELAQAGQYEAAYVALDRAQREHPDDTSLLVAKTKQRDTATAFLIYQAQAAYAAGMLDETRSLLARIEAISPNDPRTAGLQVALERVPRHRKLMEQAKADYERGQYDRAADALHTVVNEDNANTTARSLLTRVDEAREAQVQSMASSLKTADKIINLEFREAPLRTVFEALARAADVNFVFDKDVRTDSKVSLFLRNTTVDEAMRVILSTQQLDRKLLNDNSVLVYPNNAQKQREHQDLVTRSFYLVNADAKQAQNLVRTMTKSRDIFVDERLNLMVVRDTPEVLRVVERLIESLDLPESEVMLEVEIMEVSSSTVRELGLSWPTSASYGVPGSTSPIATGTDGLRAFVANPLVKATLNGSSGNANLLANPKIRARNHEKAKVQIGQKLPVFTTTSTANVGTATSVTYLDVGLKLEVEPSIQLDGDVIMKVALEVSSNNGEVKSADGTTAYLIGNRVTSTSLRLKDGETQVLAGLIQDDDRKSAAGIPGLSEVPGAGVLFGTRKTDRQKTEIVLLITPRIVRSTTLPALAGAAVPSGTDTQPGAASMRIRPGKAQVGGSTGGGMSGSLSVAGAGGQPGVGAAQPAVSATEPSLGGPDEVIAGGAFSVTVSNPTNSPISTDLLFDTSVFKASLPGGQSGRLPLQLGPKGSRSVMLQVLQQSTDTSTTLNLSVGSASLSVQVRSHQSGASSAPDGEPPQPN
jgi:general secretion pathway protein D